MKKLDYLKVILEKNPDISQVRVFEFSFLNKFQDRNKNLTYTEKNIVTSCLSYKKAYKVSFWEAVFKLVSDGTSISDRMLSHAIFHNNNQNYIELNVNDFMSYIYNETDKNIALNSRVVLSNGSEKHIPMLDFKIPSSKNNLSTVQDVVNVLGLNGMILDSGKSFHFIGYDLINENELIDLLSRFILLHPVSDKSWAAHQIIERSASLRISKKYGELPVFITEIL
ncbi:TPA: hypothetical protein ACX6QC_000571 [Photobacterium damselae]